MIKRILFTLGIALVAVAGLAVAKFEQVQAAIKAHTFTPPPTAVTTILAKQEKWPSTIKAVGTAVAVQGVTVSADLPGIVESISFDSGRRVKAGEVLVKLDTRQEEAQLAAAEADRDLALVNYNRTKALVEDGAIPRADYDKALADKSSTEAKVGEIKATIARKTIHAPFSGELGIRQVNLGQYLSAGNAVVPLQSLDPIYVNFGIPQDSAHSIHVGEKVQVAANDIPGLTLVGRVTAIDSVVDASTRNVQVQATFANPQAKLRPGMFVDAELHTGASESVIALPGSAISYAPYGNSVFVVADMKGPDGKTYRGVRQQFVKVDQSRGDLVAIVSGVNPGEEVVTSGTFRLRSGAPVSIHNEVQPSDNPAPKPEDN